MKWQDPIDSNRNDNIVPMQRVIRCSGGLKIFEKEGEHGWKKFTNMILPFRTCIRIWDGGKDHYKFSPMFARYYIMIQRKELNI